MVRTYGLYIDGKWIDTKEYFDSVNPSTEQVIARFSKASVKEAELAIDAASKAFKTWAATPAPSRAKILYRTAELLRKNKQRLGKLVSIEMGKVMTEALADVQEAIDVFEYMAGEGRRLFGHTTKSELKDKFAMTIRMPLGVCALITPWNFPIAIPAWKLSASLICGNTTILKPSSDTPYCAVELVKILEQAGIPKGVVNLLLGPGNELGQALVKSKDIRAISFTGHYSTGEWIQKNAGVDKKISLEMSGKNPIIIMDDADLSLALDGVIWGAFGTTGQRCTAASRVIIHKKIKEKLKTMLVERVKKLKVGPGYEKGTDIGPLINKAALEKTEKYVNIGKEEGAKLVIGGNRLERKGFFYKPTVFTEVTADMRIAKEEIFGPVVALIEFEKLEEAIDIANNVEYGLSTSIYTKDIRNAFKAIEGLDAGLTYVNASTIGSEVHLPFGGVKKTGHAREGGILGIDEFSYIKTVYIDYSGRLQRAQIDVEQ
jgi:aldehyde dehydrogenase (NAD+)